MAWGPFFFWTWPWTHAIVSLRFLPPPEFWSQVGFRGGSDGKESAFRAGNLGSIPGLERSPGKESSYPLQYSGLENSMDRGAWQATVHGVAKSQTLSESQRLSLSMTLICNLLR